MTIPPAVIIRAAAALIRERSEPPSVADWLEEQAAADRPDSRALGVSLTYLGES